MLQGRIVLIFEDNGAARVELDSQAVRNPIAVLDRFLRARFGKLVQLEQRRLARAQASQGAPQTSAATLSSAPNPLKLEEAPVDPVAPPLPPERPAKAVAERMAKLRRLQQSKRPDAKDPEDATTEVEVQQAEQKATADFLASHKQAPPVHPELADLTQKLKDRGVLPAPDLEESANVG